MFSFFDIRKNAIIVGRFNIRGNIINTYLSKKNYQKDICEKKCEYLNFAMFLNAIYASIINFSFNSRLNNIITYLGQLNVDSIIFILY